MAERRQAARLGRSSSIVVPTPGLAVSCVKSWGRPPATTARAMLPSLLSTSTGRRDNPVGMLGILLLLVIALMAVGTFTRRAAGGPDPPIIAGLLAGLIIAVLVMATFAVVDNAFLAVVSHRQPWHGRARPEQQRYLRRRCRH